MHHAAQDSPGNNSIMNPVHFFWSSGRWVEQDQSLPSADPGERFQWGPPGADAINPRRG